MVNNGLMVNNDIYIYICKLTIVNNRGYDQQECGHMYIRTIDTR